MLPGDAAATVVWVWLHSVQRAIYTCVETHVYDTLNPRLPPGRNSGPDLTLSLPTGSESEWFTPLRARKSSVFTAARHVNNLFLMAHGPLTCVYVRAPSSSHLT